MSGSLQRGDTGNGRRGSAAAATNRPRQYYGDDLRWPSQYFRTRTVGNSDIYACSPDDTGLPKDGAMELKSVVRARIVLTGNNLVALRDLLIRAIKEQGGDERRH
jgi:hypothetical protein